MTGVPARDAQASKNHPVYQERVDVGGLPRKRAAVTVKDPRDQVTYLEIFCNIRRPGNISGKRENISRDQGIISGNAVIYQERVDVGELPRKCAAVTVKDSRKAGW